MIASHMMSVSLTSPACLLTSTILHSDAPSLNSPSFFLPRIPLLSPRLFPPFFQVQLPHPLLPLLLLPLHRHLRHCHPLGSLCPGHRERSHLRAHLRHAHDAPPLLQPSGRGHILPPGRCLLPRRLHAHDRLPMHHPAGANGVPRAPPPHHARAARVQERGRCAQPGYLRRPRAAQGHALPGGSPRAEHAQLRGEGRHPVTTRSPSSATRRTAVHRSQGWC